MHKISPLLLVILLASVGAGITAENTTALTLQAGEITQVRLTWDDDPKTTIVVMFQSASAGIGTCEYGETAALGDVETLSEEKTLHEIKITGLTPDTSYYYKVGVGTSWSEIYQFKTAPDSVDTTINFLAWGDSRGESTESRTNRKAIADFAAEFNPEFQIHTGDMVTEGKDMGHWDAFFEDVEAVNAIAPVMAAVGNHETPQLSLNYENLYALPANEYYYSLDYGPVHVTILNTEALHISDLYGDFLRDQRDWLIQDLATTHQPWKVVVFHRPFYTTGSHYADDSLLVHRELLEPIFKQYEVDLVFSGHDHMYERSYKDEINYITTGGAGAPVYMPSPNADTTYSVKQVSENHIIMVEASATSLRLDAYFINGSIFDTFTLDKKSEELAISKFEITETPLNPSSTFELTATVTNFGEVDLIDVPVEFNLDAWSWTEQVDIEVNEQVEITTSAALTISEKTVANVTIDPLDNWDETNEFNNFKEIMIDFPEEGIDLTINRLVSIGENPTELNLGVEIANLGLTTANDFTIDYFFNFNHTVVTIDVAILEGLEKEVIAIGTFSLETHILADLTIDPNQLISEAVEDNNYLLAGWNEKSNITSSGATFAEYLQKGKNLKIGYGTEGVLYAEPEIKVLWSIDGWTTYTEQSMTKLVDSWEVEIEAYPGMNGIAFGFRAEDQIIFDPAWVSIQAEGERGKIVTNRFIDIAKTDLLTVNFLDSENFTKIPQTIEGWIIFQGVKYEPVHGEGYLEIAMPDIDIGKFYIYTYAWTEGYVAIKDLTLLTFTNSTKEPIDTTDPSDGDDGSLSIVLPALGIAVITLNRRKKR
ncbi:MAG: metallophosphoesterase [Candidatus Kariarchaeaceae archaeon]